MKIIKVREAKGGGGVARRYAYTYPEGREGAEGCVGVVECGVKPDQYGRKRTTVANPRHINQEKGQSRTDGPTDGPGTLANRDTWFRGATCSAG